MEEPKDKRTKAYKQWKAQQNIFEEAREKDFNEFKAQQPKKVKMGLGDAIAKITEATGIDKLVGDDCGCDERKKALNKIKLPFRTKMQRCFTPEQYNLFSDYRERRTLKSWNQEDIKLLVDLYAHVFALQYSVKDLCVNCAGSGKILFKIDEQLEIVYNEHEKG